jgi:hypothetical protein
MKKRRANVQINNNKGKNINYKKKNQIFFQNKLKQLSKTNKINKSLVNAKRI